MNALAAWAAPHLPVLVGLLFGTLGKYGLALDEGAAIEPRKVLGHLMMLGLLGLLAEAMSELTNATPTWRALAGAGAAIAAGKVVRRYQRYAERQAEQRMPLPPRDQPPA